MIATVRSLSRMILVSRRWLAVSVLLAATQAALLVPVGLLLKRAFDDAIPEGDVDALVLIGVALLVLSLVVVDVPVREPFVLVVALALALLLFSALGVVVGIYAESWDHTAFVNNLVILPLTFLGGVFYSVDVLPSPWEELSHANPIFFLVQAVRFGFLGTSDVSVVLALGVTGALAAIFVAWSTWLFATGRRLKP